MEFLKSLPWDKTAPWAIAFWFLIILAMSTVE